MNELAYVFELACIYNAVELSESKLHFDINIHDNSIKIELQLFFQNNYLKFLLLLYQLHLDHNGSMPFISIYSAHYEFQAAQTG